MDIKLQEKLKQSFPNLYKRTLVDDPGTPFHCMEVFGVECGDGWYDLIYDLSAKLEKEILKKPEEERKNFYAVQVKEKYASLRFYMTHETEEMDNLISQAEKRSQETCEVCGKPGKVRGHGWLTTLCDECDTKK